MERKRRENGEKKERKRSKPRVNSLGSFRFLIKERKSLEPKP